MQNNTKIYMHERILKGGIALEIREKDLSRSKELSLKKKKKIL